MRPVVELYCDGACLGNPGPGGWAYLLRYRGAAGPREEEKAGAEASSTNNRMELTAAIRGLERLKLPCTVNLFCDSQYVVKGLESWLEGWKAAGWRKADGGPVLNKDLWMNLDGLRVTHRIKATWVRGHAGHPENERVDRLARVAAEGVDRDQALP